MNIFRKNIKYISAAVSILVIGVALPISLKLLSTPTKYNVPALAPEVNLSIAPAAKNMPPDSVFRVMLDTGTNKVSFARVAIDFDKTKINLKPNSVINTTPLMSRVIKKSTLAEATTSGRLVIALAAAPGATPAAGVIEIASFTMTTISPTANDTTEIKFATSDNQFVDENATNLGIKLSSANVVLNATSSTTTPTVIPTLIPTGTIKPTNTPTSTPKPTNTPTPPSGTNTVTLNVASAGDDGYDVAGSSTFNTSLNGEGGQALIVGGKKGSASVTTGLRFNGVTIPQGKTIISAKLDLAESWGGAYDTNVKDKIFAEKSPNCATFNSSSLPRNRVKTTASVNWNSNGSQGTAGQWYQTSASAKPPEMATVVQEVINQSPWTSGNSMCILITDNGSTDDWWFEPRSFEAGAAHAAKLIITYIQ